MLSAYGAEELPAVHQRSRQTLDTIVGRSDDLARLLSRLQTARVTCVTGPGGTGKTRLVMELVNKLSEAGQEAWFVDLSAETDPSTIDSAIVAAMGLDVEPGEPPDRALQAHFADRVGVLVLDNLEQIEGARVTLARAVASLPSAKVVATSRVPLDLPGEVEVRLGPLQLPHADDPASVERSESGQLFLRRARAHGALESLDDPASKEVARLLRQLDGLPLAIELAAARTKLITVPEILGRVERLGIAAIDRPTAGTQKSLRRIVEWTIGLLSADAVELLKGACEVAGFDLLLGETLAPHADGLDAIEGLLDAGLVRRWKDAAGTSRFDVFETVRSVVRARTTDAERQAVLERVARGVADLIEAAAPSAERDPLILLRLDAEAGNIRRALDWFEDVDPTRALHLWNLLFYPFWARQGRIHEGMARFERTAAKLEAPNEELAKAMVRYAMNQLWVADESETRAVMLRALDVTRSVGDAASEIEALAALSGTAVNEGDDRLARDILDQLDAMDAPSLRTELKMRVAEARHHAAATIHGQASDEAITHLLAAISYADVAGQSRAAAALNGNLAIARLHRNEATLAVEAAERSVSLCRSTGSSLLAWALCGLAMSHAIAKDAKSAQRALAGAIAETEAIGKSVQVCDTLLAAILVAVESSKPVLGVMAWGAARAIEARGEADIPHDDRLLAERSLQHARQMLTPVEFRLAMSAGQAQDPISLLRSLPEALGLPGTGDARAGGRLRHGELTSREVEVLRLVGMGHTDSQIAEVLFISPKTASVHVSNVKGKLGASSRLEVALRAREIGLLDDAVTSNETGRKSEN